jgi:SHS2 domain-containing protein
MYEIFEHTADLGLRVRAHTLDELFADAGRGLFQMIVANLEDVRPVEKVEFAIDGIAFDFLLFDWLNELLYTFESRQLLFSQFQVRVGDTGLIATCAGEPADVGRHQMEHEVKAITYHGLRVEQSSDGWMAEVIVDI